MDEKDMDEKNIRKHYAQWLCTLERLDGRAVRRIEEKFGDYRQLFEADEMELSQVLTKGQLQEFLVRRKKARGEEGLISENEKILRRGISFVWREEEAYPRRLKEIPDAPVGLFYVGSLPLEEKISVAIIGARECSAYGEYVTKELSAFLAKRKVQIISGMARGVDGIGQRTALDCGGTSYGVLGCGVDICYPESNRDVYDRLCEQGGVLSALPPGTVPIPRYFPPRNRIVSGLSDCVIVVEARLKSGTMITVDMALEQGREVYIVPGRITDRCSDGCNKLIKEGAGVILSAEQFFEELSENMRGQKMDCPVEYEQQTLDFCHMEYEGDLGRVYGQIGLSPVSVQSLSENLKIPLSTVSICLMQLCLEHKIAQVSPGSYVRIFG